LLASTSKRPHVDSGEYGAAMKESIYVSDIVDPADVILVEDGHFQSLYVGGVEEELSLLELYPNADISISTKVAYTYRLNRRDGFMSEMEAWLGGHLYVVYGAPNGRAPHHNQGFEITRVADTNWLFIPVVITV